MTLLILLVLDLHGYKVASYP